MKRIPRIVRVDHKVAIITGAAEGMDKADALLLAIVIQAANFIIYPLASVNQISKYN